MALSARRLDVLCRKNRLLPSQRAVVRLLDSRCRSLPAMADRASEFVQLMGNHGVSPVRLPRHIGQSGFLQSNVATGATIDHPEFRQPDLLDASLEVPLQRVRFAAVADHPQIAVLIMPPLAEEILRWSNRQ